jgi:hypothetical protein
MEHYKEKLENLILEKGQTKKLQDGEFLIVGTLLVEGGSLIIENAKLIFTEGSGILVHDGTFEATNSTFEPHYYNAGWVNVSLVGNIKGFIRNCSFEAGKGREDTIFAELGFFEEKKENTYGGCLFIFNSNPSVFEVSNCSFKNSEADFGGGAYVDGRVRVINCNFFNCKANWDGGGLSVGRGVEVIKCKFEHCKAPNRIGGGLVADKRNLIRDCLFSNCRANGGGGAYLWEENRLENCAFATCQAHVGGGLKASERNEIVNCHFANCYSKDWGGCVYLWEGNSLEGCQFENCISETGGGAIYCHRHNRLGKNRYKNCKPKNVQGKCKVPCFITTATLQALGKNETADDCYELNLFRQYRDNYLLSTPEGYQLVEEYYRISPFIVEKINAQPNKEEIYQHLWEKYLKPCLREIEQENFERVKEIYIQMVEELKKLYF